MAIVTSLKDAEALAAAAAERITSLIEASIAARQGASLCLAGGQTPRRLYELLADVSRPWRARIDWARVHVFWGDERHVPPDHAESNFGLAYRALLAHVPLPAAQVCRIHGELADAADAARDYEIELSGAGLNGPPRGWHPTAQACAAGTPPGGSAPHPLFDVLLLGLGEDAHIASIFPGSILLNRSGVGRVAAVRVEQLHAWRITLTPPALLAARHILVLASGANKAEAVHAALDAPLDLVRCPAHILRAAGDRVEWLIDSAAAQRRAAPPS